jgi:hypothetical protein
MNYYIFSQIESLERSMYLNNVPIELRNIAKFYAFNQYDSRFLKYDYDENYRLQIKFNKSVIPLKQFIKIINNLLNEKLPDKNEKLIR